MSLPEVCNDTGIPNLHSSLQNQGSDEERLIYYLQAIKGQLQGGILKDLLLIQIILLSLFLSNRKLIPNI